MFKLVFICLVAISAAIAQSDFNETTGATSEAPMTPAENVTEEDFAFLDALEFVDPPSPVSSEEYSSERYERADDDDNNLPEPNASVATSNVTAVKKCVARSACYKHEECGRGPRGSARCVGIFVGKCDCTACVSGLPCSSEATCGGLHNSCSNLTGICDCIKAHKANGFSNFGQALLKFCNHQDCDEDSDTCFGLPCRRGRCVCL